MVLALFVSPGESASLSAISSFRRKRGILPLSSLQTSASMYPSGATL